MAKLHKISTQNQNEIAILEHDARDIITLANTLRALLDLRDGAVIRGLPPVEYIHIMQRLLEAIRKGDDGEA